MVKRRTRQNGMTIIEVLIALALFSLVITTVTTATSGSSDNAQLSRRFTEASVLAEDLLEKLRLTPAITLVSGTDIVNPDGEPDPNGIFTRTWTVTPLGALLTIDVQVSWSPKGSSQTKSVSMTTRRAL